ncbi:MAG: hypothetical protein GEU90_07290 [Gemmatimonas sp.]|nr:hypothetical protein [Gemmatimonas sp.]
MLSRRLQRRIPPRSAVVLNGGAAAVGWGRWRPDDPASGVNVMARYPSDDQPVGDLRAARAEREPENGELFERLGELRRAEKLQALVYRHMAARAEAAGEVELAHRFHGLHADEQHHLSRLTARMLELGANPADLSTLQAPPASLDDWQEIVRTSEAAEIDRYRSLDRSDLDEVTRSLVDEILSVEERHAQELGGKWTVA